MRRWQNRHGGDMFERSFSQSVDKVSHPAGVPRNFARSAGGLHSVSTSGYCLSAVRVAVPRLSLRWSLHEGGKQIDGHGEEGSGVVLAGDLAHGLEETKLEGNRFFANHRGGLDHFFRGLELAFGIDDFGAALA